jgi:hypothetical protein
MRSEGGGFPMKNPELTFAEMRAFGEGQAGSRGERVWWGRPDLNRRPTPCKGVVLTRLDDCPSFFEKVTELAINFGENSGKRGD